MDTDGHRFLSVSNAQPAPGAINEDAAHGFGGGAGEMPPVLPTFLLIAQQTQVGLMNQGCGLQSLPRRLERHFSSFSSRLLTFLLTVPTRRARFLNGAVRPRYRWSFVRVGRAVRVVSPRNWHKTAGSTSGIERWGMSWAKRAWRSAEYWPFMVNGRRERVGHARRWPGPKPVVIGVRLEVSYREWIAQQKEQSRG